MLRHLGDNRVLAVWDFNGVQQLRQASFGEANIQHWTDDLDTAVRIPVETGLVNATDTEILSGLTSNDTEVPLLLPRNAAGHTADSRECRCLL